MSGGDFNGVPVVRLRSSDNSIAIDGSGDIDIRTAGGVVAPFTAAVMGANSASPIVPTTILSLPFTAGANGFVLADVDATVQVTPPAAPAGLDASGVVFTFAVDGNPTSAFAYFQMDPGGAGTVFDTFAQVIRLRELLLTTPGAHTLDVQWVNVTVATPSLLTTFAAGGLLTVQGV